MFLYMDDIIDMSEELKDFPIIFINCGQLSKKKKELTQISKNNKVIEIIVFPPLSEIARRKLADIIATEIKEGRFPCLDRNSEEE